MKQWKNNLLLIFTIVILCLFATGLLYLSQGDNFSNMTDTVFYYTKSLDKVPTPRFGNIDLNSALHYPVNNVFNGQSAVPCQDCEPFKQPEEKEQESTTPLQQSVVVDRLIFANRNSQLRAMGDPFRGDLPIVPNPPGWFTPSVSPQIDLQRGALNYLAGDNAASQQLDDLFSKATSGLLPSSQLPFSTVSGNTYAQLGNRGQDLTVTSQP